jgi:hypothetical protein
MMIGRARLVIFPVPRIFHNVKSAAVGRAPARAFARHAR